MSCILQNFIKYYVQYISNKSFFRGSVPVQACILMKVHSENADILKTLLTLNLPEDLSWAICFVMDLVQSTGKVK